MAVDLGAKNNETVYKQRAEELLESAVMMSVALDEIAGWSRTNREGTKELLTLALLYDIRCRLEGLQSIIVNNNRSKIAMI